MVIIISPSKTLNLDIQSQTALFSQAEFTDESAKLIDKLKKYTPASLQELMSINPNLAQINALRFMEWSLPFSPENAKQALLTFKGEVFNGLKAETLTEPELQFAQEHLRILSGLYGVLRPLDLIQPYRLEMGTKLKVRRKNNLYEFWGDILTKNINKLLQSTQQKYIINLASTEYFKALNQKKLNAEIITPTFKDYKNGTYKFLTVYGKKARGMMARFIINNRIEDIENIKLFDEDGYYYNDKLSKGNNWVFTRG